MQEIRIQYRWEAIEQENNQLMDAKSKGEKTEIDVFENGDTRKQLFARSRYLLYKSREKWTVSQKQRAEILFSEYPEIEKSYHLSDALRKIYNQRVQKSVAMLKLAQWFNLVQESGLKSFSILMKTIMNQYNDTLNYFDQRSTNAAAESFNAKIKKIQTAIKRSKRKSVLPIQIIQNFCLVPKFCY